MRTTIVHWIAAACIALPCAAHAIDVTSVPAANKLTIAGDPIVDRELLGLALLGSARGLCRTGTVDIYIDDSPSSTPSAYDFDLFFTIACLGTRTVFDSRIAISKRSLLPLAGAKAVANQTPLDFINTSAPLCDPATISVPASVDFIAYTLHTNCVGLMDVVPDATVSFTDPDLITGLTPAEASNLFSAPLLQVIQAPAVTLGLYRALQLSQGLPQDDLPENTPTLTSSQLVSILAGVIGDWADFRTSTGSVFAQGPTAPAGFGGAVTQIFMCRRGEDAGIQSYYDAVVLNQRCNPSAAPFVNPSDVTCLTAGCQFSSAYQFDFVFAGIDDEDVINCLDWREGQGLFAIGLLPTSTFTNNTTREFRFIGLDGSRPTLASVANGNYDGVASPQLSGNIGAFPAGVAGDVIQLVSDLFGVPESIAPFNRDYQNPNGDNGFLAPFSATTVLPNPPPVSQATMRLRPVSPFTRAATGSINHCQKPATWPGFQIIGGTD